MNEGLIVQWLVKWFGASWKTTLSGLLAGVAIVWPEAEVMFDSDPSTRVVWSHVFGGLLVAYLGKTARQTNVSSEQEAAAKTGVQPTDVLGLTPAAKVALMRVDGMEMAERSASRVGPNETGTKG